MTDLVTINKMTSIEIAELTGKQHAHIMRDIRDEIEKLEVGGVDYQSKFGLVKYRDAKGEMRDCYYLTKEGVLQLAARYDAIVRAKLIEAVLMQEQQTKVPKTFAEALRLAADLEEERQKLLPKAESFDDFMSAAGNLSIEETAKTLNIPGVGRNKLFDILVFRKILFRKSGFYEAYQEYVNSGYFVHKQVPIKKGDAIEQRTQVFVTPKGLDWLSRKLKTKEAI